MNQNQAPLFEALSRYFKKKVKKFHVPGHQYGQGLSSQAAGFLEKAAKFDLSVLEEIDSLSYPQSVIKKAQEMAADCFGADKTLFLVNGSTIGVIAMILSVCSLNDKILVARNMHQSVVAGLILSGAKPVYLQPEFDSSFNLPLNIKPEIVKKALEKNPDTKAVLIISPSQFGITCDLKKIAQIVHQAGKILLVDEAWGAHLKFHQEFPLPALESGADLVVQSTHKRLPALSQSSMLHINERRIDTNKIQKILRLLQTTSPSYILLASLDLVRKQMALNGKKLWSQVINLANQARASIEKMGFKLFQRDYLNKTGFDLDLTNLTLEVKNGFQAWSILNQNKIEPEFATLNHLILLLGIGNSKSDISHLLKTLKKVKKGESREIKYPIIKPTISFSPYQASLKETEKVKLDKAKNRISAQILAPYPPGIPLLVPGELITEEIYQYLKEIIKYHSARMSVLEEIETIEVIK